MKKWNTYISHLRSVFCIILACNHQVIALNINKNINDNCNTVAAIQYKYTIAQMADLLRNK